MYQMLLQCICLFASCYDGLYILVLQFLLSKASKLLFFVIVCTKVLFILDQQKFRNKILKFWFTFVCLCYSRGIPAMTHPAVYAITLGVALGAALFAYFAAAKFRQENPHGGYNDNEWRYRRSESDPWGGPRTRNGRENCTICLDPIEKAHSIRLPCDHEFHRKCLAELRKTSNLCPNCRREF